MDKLSSMNAFIKVAEANSFSLAAMQLGIGYSAITRSISSLEKHLGVKLMERTTRRLALTPAGATYLECCRHVVDMIESTEADLASDCFELAGLIRVGLSNLHGNRIFGPLLMKFAKVHQCVKFEVLHFDLLTDAMESEVDIALLVSDERKKPREAVSLGRIPMHLVAAPEYFEQYGRPTRPDELIAHRCLNLSTTASKPTWQFAEQGVFTDYRVNSCLNIRNGDGLLDAALAGLGLACLPVEIVDTHLRERKLEIALEDFSLAPLEASLLVSSDKLVTQRTKALAKSISEHFGSAF